MEQVLEARAANSAHRPESLDKPVTEDGEPLLDLAGGSIDPGYERAETAAVVDGLMSRLGEREREILRLRFAEDLTQAEIGEQMGISQMHVSRLIRDFHQHTAGRGLSAGLPNRPSSRYSYRRRDMDGRE